MSFGSQLKNLRENKKYTQEELANKIGVGRSSVANYETDVNFPRKEILDNILKILDCNYSETRGLYYDEPDILDDAQIGMSREKYEALTDEEKEQIRIFLKLMTKDK